jgi:ADP-dependent NAD(P)H-hydrate dehydratase / NAD(P)H-hydrate epimerase
MQISRIVSVDEMRAIEAAADQAGVTYAAMMESAGRAVAETILVRIDNPVDHKIVVLAGTGNNGGDGLVAAHHLAEAGATVAVYLVRPADEADPKVHRLREKGLLLADAENDQRWRVLKNLMGSVTVLIDAVLGTGARLPVTGKSADLLKYANEYLSERSGGLPLRVAVDCPSGMDCDTGELDTTVIPAEVTVTLGAAKRGHFQFPAADAVGELVIAGIGLEEAHLPQLEQLKVVLADQHTVRRLLPVRPRNSHKGTFGRTLIVAGSANYTGAAYLAGVAAYRIGAGLVTLAIPSSLYPVLAAQLPEATWVMLPHEMGVLAGPAAAALRKEYEQSQALLIGPGLGTEKETANFFRRWLGVDEQVGARRGHLGFVAQRADDEEAGDQPLPPLVIDADGLNLLAQIDAWHTRLPAESVLTPHPGEMARLTGLEKNAIQADRIGTACRFAGEWKQTVVLKGAYTVVAAPDGRAAVMPFATAALARAGTGDVLAGAIAGLRAQGLTAYDAAVAGAYLHGLAGVMAAELLGTLTAVMASDILDGLVEALAAIGAD